MHPLSLLASVARIEGAHVILQSTPCLIPCTGTTEGERPCQRMAVCGTVCALRPPVLECTVRESFGLAKYDEPLDHDYSMACSLTHQFQALMWLQTAHLQRARRLVVKIQARKIV